MSPLNKYMAFTPSGHQPVEQHAQGAPQNWSYDSPPGSPPQRRPCDEGHSAKRPHNRTPVAGWSYADDTERNGSYCVVRVIQNENGDEAALKTLTTQHFDPTMRSMKRKFNPEASKKKYLENTFLLYEKLLSIPEKYGVKPVPILTDAMTKDVMIATQIMIAELVNPENLLDQAYPEEKKMACLTMLTNVIRSWAETAPYTLDISPSNMCRDGRILDLLDDIDRLKDPDLNDWIVLITTHLKQQHASPFSISDWQSLIATTQAVPVTETNKAALEELTSIFSSHGPLE